jgi:hypothetical protein
MRRFRRPVALLALLAVAVLVLRPAGLKALGAPYGAHFSPEVQMTQAEGSPHCMLLADCETVSISNVGLDLSQAGIVLVLAGILLVVTTRRARMPRSWTALVPNPPPLFALS